MTTLNITTGVLKQALTALKEAHQKAVERKEQETQKHDLFGSMSRVSLVVAIEEVPLQAIKKSAYYIPIPHPFRQFGETEVCCFATPTRSNKLYNYMTKNNKKFIKKIHDIKHYNKVVVTYEQKRKLCDSYDLFVAQKELCGRLPQMLNNYFYKKKKHAHLISLDDLSTVEDQVKNIVESTYLFVQNGPCSGVMVGTTDMEDKDLSENIRAVITYLTNAEKCPFPASCVTSIHLKAERTPSIPIYISARSIERAEKKAAEKKRKLEAKINGENKEDNDNEDSSDEDFQDEEEIDDDGLDADLVDEVDEIDEEEEEVQPPSKKRKIEGQKAHPISNKKQSKQIDFIKQNLALLKSKRYI